MPAVDVSRVVIVVPAWNEEMSVAAVVTEIMAALPTASVLVVNDGSSDRTSRVARHAGALVLDLPFNVGVGGAMRAGFRYALSVGAQAVVQVDADGQHDPRDLPQILAGLNDADVVVGSRFGERSGYEVRGPRRWAMRLLAVSLSRIAGTRLTDVTSGFRATGHRALPLFAAHYPAEYLGDTVESLVIASRAGCRIRQVQVNMRVRSGGTPSQHPWKAAAYLLRAILALLVALTRPRSQVPQVST